ncbi:MAG: hypothetical protein LC776_02185 [Acidobacteria bacterium]|nr:hypothetical protein [Acidobacteriota bacterium]
MAIERSVTYGLVVGRRDSYPGRVDGLHTPSITHKLADHLRRGELLDLAPDLAVGSPLDEAVMKSWDGTHVIAADDIRDLLCGRTVTDPDPRGLRLRAACIRGRLDLDNLTTTVKLTLVDCLLDEGITAQAAHLPGLSLRRCLLSHVSEPALYADELRTDATVSLEGSRILACAAEGAVRLNGAHIGGQLNCSAATITNVSGSALHGERLKVNDNVLVSAGFRAIGAGEQGAVRLVGAHIGGQLDCSGAAVSNGSGPAVQGGHLHVEGNIILCGDFTAQGDGAVCLRWARVGGQLNCSGATITTASGPALSAGAMQVAGSVLLTAGFKAHGDSERGAVRLTGARIGIQLECSGATITNSSGPALHGERLEVGGDIWLRAGFTAEGEGELGTIRLSGARVGGHLDCSGAVVTSRSSPQHRWLLDGLTYPRLPLDPLERGTAGWLDLLRTATPAYAAQPYQQLASVNQAAGHDRDVRQIHIAQRRAQLDRRVLTGRDRFWVKITGLTLGYGYQPWRALLILLGIVLTSVVLTVILGAHGALVHQDPKDPAGMVVPCSISERIDVGLDIGAPFLNTYVQNPCTTTNTATGIGLKYGTQALQLLTGAVAALFVAGFTGIVRKT